MLNGFNFVVGVQEFLRNVFFIRGYLQVVQHLKSMFFLKYTLKKGNFPS